MTNEQRVAQDKLIARLERREKRLEKALLAARLARSAAMYCLCCDEVKCVCASLESSAGRVVYK